MKQAPVKVLVRRSFIAASGLALGLAIGFAAAQDNSGLKQPSPSAPNTSIPEKIVPPEQGVPSPPGTIGRGRDESLSDKLDRSDGVITPPANIDPELRVPAPVPDPGTTIVIPPPGSPGNPSTDRPK